LIAQINSKKFSSQIQDFGAALIIAGYRRQDPADERPPSRPCCEGHLTLPRLEDLAAAFQQPRRFHLDIGELLNHRRAWRGELLLRSEGNRERPLIDPGRSRELRAIGCLASS